MTAFRQSCFCICLLRLTFRDWFQTSTYNFINIAHSCELFYHAGKKTPPSECWLRQYRLIKAADALYISTPAVVQQINLLEDSLGFRVFERSNRGVKLTPAGRSLYEDAKTLLHLADDAVKKARRIAESGDTAVRIGTSPLYKCRMLPDLWTKVSEIVPMREYDSRDNVFSRLGREFDLFEGIYATAWADCCRFLELSRTPVCCAMARNHRLAGRSRRTADDLDGESLVMPPEGVSAELDEFRKILLAAHPSVKVTESAYYGVDTFTLCEMTTYILVTQPVYADIHPGLVTIPLDMEREITMFTQDARCG